ncbi:60S ribosomal protein L14 [Trichonephila inaurata madagascariensis]|uniref:Large ribosomal subunit protein eL14 n=1 Tax=Trichonephila inaurata madagascariensis TaxID=2747483 RepID=A0A8X7CBQ8_9ARAC|nr:60S ribosomal protein L14 [Trichonephila inaurata madagascariensis]
MSFRHLVQIGRIAFISSGTDAGKLCAIVDVIDQNRALIDGPCTDVKRQAIHFKRLRLTKFRIMFPHSAGSNVVRKLWEKENITEKWKETTTAKKIAARALKVAMTDYDRFRVYKVKQQMNRIINNAYFRLKSKEKKNPTPSKRKGRRIARKLRLKAAKKA